MHAELLVVGGGPAALAAATSYRDHGGEGPVVIVSADTVPPYARPPLSKEFLRGEAEAGDTELTPATTYTDRALTLLLRRRVTALDARDRTAWLGDEPLTYASCVLATGSVPQRIPVPGADDPGIATLRSLDDARELRIAATAARTAVVVGSGFVGCEAAASLAHRGLAVTVVSAEELPQAERLGAEAGRRLAGWLESDGVTVRGGCGVEEIAPRDGDPGARARRVRLADGTVLDTDLVLLATGIAPQSGLAEEAGAATEQGRLVVDEHMRASVPGLLAAGDVALAHNPAAGRRLAVEHWGEAEAMGAVAGAAAAGAGAVWDAVPGFWTDIGGRTLKYAAWGDGFASAHLVDHGEGSFTVWYADEAGRAVGVATHRADDDLERGTELVARGEPLPGPARAGR